MTTADTILSHACPPLVQLVPAEPHTYRSPIVVGLAYTMDGPRNDGVAGLRGALIDVCSDGDCEVALFNERGGVCWEGWIHHSRLTRPAA